MTTYVIGDLQACLQPLQQLLDAIAFSPRQDHLVFCGDLVNRGPDSLGTLRFVRDLGKSATIVLGNHDLHLLAVAHGGKLGDKDSFGDILDAPDRKSLLDWLIRQPLAWQDPRSQALVIHAGVAPQWTLPQTLLLANEVHQTLTGADGKRLLAKMYGNDPDVWSEDLQGIPRLRFIINCLTRLRYCDTDGRLHMKPKGAPGSQPRGLLPWFAVPKRKTANDTLIFGHWSTLGKVHWPAAKVYGLDSGCVWGGCLTALNLANWKTISVGCGQYRKPGIIED